MKGWKGVAIVLVTGVLAGILAVPGASGGTPISDKYASLGGANGFLGPATSPETVAPDGVGKFRHYTGGSIYWTTQTGAHEVHGAIRSKWSGLGWELGVLGYPITDEWTTPDGVGRYNHFQKGSVYWTPQTGAHEVHGPIRNRWAALGWERGFLGYPTTDQQSSQNGLVVHTSTFQGGKITHIPGMGTPKESPVRVIRVQFLTVRDSDGTRSAGTGPVGSANWIEKANAEYARAGIRFAYDPETDWATLDDTEINRLSSGDESGWAHGNDVAAQYPGKLVVFSRWGPDPDAATGNGFASIPGYGTQTNFVVMPGFDNTNVITGRTSGEVLGSWVWRQNIWLFAHEAGHYLGLSHTFPGGSDEGTDTHAEVNQYVQDHGDGPSALDGDGLSDTPPEPGTGYYIRHAWDPCGPKSSFTTSYKSLTWTPDRHNVMSYFACDDMSFSPMQIAILRATALSRGVA
jgi:hypothetical protein